MTTMEERIERAAKALAAEDYGRSVEWVQENVWDKVGAEEDANEEFHREEAVATYRESARLAIAAFLEGDRELFEVTERDDDRDLNGVEAWEGDSLPNGSDVGAYIGALVKVEVPE